MPQQQYWHIYFINRQKRWIIKYKCKVILNLDQDKAGKESTIAIGDLLTKNNINYNLTNLTYTFLYKVNVRNNYLYNKS